MKSISFQVLLVLTLFFTSCITGKKTAKYFQDKEAQQNTITLKDIKITPTRKDNFRTTPIRSMDILHMDLDVRFNWGKHECIGKETILLKPYFYAQDSIVLDAKNMIFDGITVTDMRDNPIQYLVNYDKKILKIQLEKKISSQDSIKLSISYVASPDLKEKGGSRAIKDDKGLYFINTDNQEPYKPIQLWTQGETESNSCWFPTIDKPNEKFTSKLSITVNKEMTTLSNGALINSITNETQRTDTWENTQPMSAYLIMMAVGNFIPTKDQWRGKEVSYYLEPDYSPYARSIFNNTSDMLEYYSNRLGVEYPWNKYAQVVVRDYVSGAMENTSATLHGEFVQKNNRELIDNNNDGIIAHELFHQWFGDLVTCKSWSHLVLNEGFATYGEQLWIEHKEGKDASLRKCYNTINRYISYAKNASDDAIVNFNYKDKEDMFNTLTYQKGSRVIHLLRSILGDDAFFLGLKNYLTHYAFNNAELDDLRKEFENVSGQDLRPFFQQWFLQGGHPIIDLRYDYIDSLGLLAVTVEQKQTSDVGLFQFPLAFKVTQGRLSKMYNFQMDKKKEVFYVKKLDIDNPDRVDVNVDPEAIFIGEIIDHKPFFNHILTYNRATNYIEKVRPLKELALLQNQNDSVRFTLLSAINDADDDIRLKALEWINWKNPDNLLKTKDILINIARNDNHAEVRSKAVEILSDTMSPELMNVYFDLVNDSSYTVAGEALQAIFRIIPEEAYRQCPRLEKDARGKLFSTISDIYASSGTLNDTAFFNSNLMRVYGSRRSALLTDYTTLILRQQNDELNQQHIQRLTLHAQSSMYSTVRVTAIKQLKSIKDYYSQLESKTTDPALKSQYKLSTDQLTQSIDSIIAQEKDTDVISQLKFSGIIPANYEIKSGE